MLLTAVGKIERVFELIKWDGIIGCGISIGPNTPSFLLILITSELGDLSAAPDAQALEQKLSPVDCETGSYREKCISPN